MRAIDYSQAAGTDATSLTGPVKTAKVDNPYGSVAGAGSGEFHVYRHARSREMERWKKLEEEERQQEMDAEFQKKLANSQTEEEVKTAQRRKKRQRQKEAKSRKRNLQLAGVNIDIAESATSGKDDEFTYISVYDEKGKELNGISSVLAESTEATFVNDGTFLEMMKAKQLSQETVPTITSDALTNEIDDEKPAAKKQAVEKV